MLIKAGRIWLTTWKTCSRISENNIKLFLVKYLNAVNSVAESWTGIGVVVGFLTGAGMMESPYLKMTAYVSLRRYLQTLQSVRLIGKTRNHLPLSRSQVVSQ